ncbi:MAG: hypothetical protein AAF434_11920 [Pseudomonadota bacterium]
MAKRLIVFVMLGLLSPLAIACKWPEAESVRVDSDHVLFYRFAPEQPAVGEFFLMNLKFCRDGKFVDPDSIRADATMPAHAHGMNYRVTIAQAGHQIYEARGFLLHMTGLWRFEIVFKDGKKRRRVLFDYQLN